MGRLDVDGHDNSSQDRLDPPQRHSAERSRNAHGTLDTPWRLSDARQHRHGSNVLDGTFHPYDELGSGSPATDRSVSMRGRHRSRTTEGFRTQSSVRTE